MTTVPLPSPASPAPAWRGHLPGLLFVALFAYAITRLAARPALAGLGLSPLIVGIAAGLVFGNLQPGSAVNDLAPGIHFAARRLLRIAVALFGLRVSLQEIVQVGLPGLAESVLIVASTMSIGTWAGVKLMRLDRETALLTAAGSAICGAAAVLACESALRARPHQSAAAVGSVVLFGTLSMFAYPLAYRAGWLPLDAQGLGLFYGGTIHEVAQVVGAASGVSPEVVHIATIVKMTRVMLLVPVLLAAGIWFARPARGAQDSARTAQSPVGRKRPALPWFALGFVALVIVNSLHVLPPAAVSALDSLDTFALTMSMAALGMETRLPQVRAAGPRALATGAVLYVWLIVGGYAITWCVERAFG